MTLTAGIILVVVCIVSVIAVLWIFVWAARKDGEDQRRRDLTRPPGQGDPRQDAR